MKLDDAHELDGVVADEALSGPVQPAPLRPPAEAVIAKLRRRVIQLEQVEQELRVARRDIRRLQDLNLNLSERNRQAEAALDGALQAIDRFKASTSWKLTAPIRAAVVLSRVLWRGAAAWLSFRPGSRPHRVSRRVAQALGRSRRSEEAAADAPIFELCRDEVQAGPKRQVLYLFLDATVAAPKAGGDQQTARALCATLLESPHLVRMVKWDADIGACVLLDRDDLARLDQWEGPTVTADQADLYPPPGTVVRARPRPGSASWLIVPETPRITASALVDWAKSEGLKTGFVVQGVAAAPELSALRRADCLWPTSAWAADRLAAQWSADGEPLPAIRPMTPPTEFGRPRVRRERTGERLVLCAGDIGPGEDSTVLIRAFNDILAERPDSGWTLAMMGRVDPAAMKAVKALAGPAIQVGEPASDGDRTALYARSAFTVCLAEDEAGRQQVLESLWEAKPCLCPSAGAPAEAAADGGCLMVDMGDPAAVKTELARLMDQADLRHSLAEAAIHAADKSWGVYLANLEAAGPGAESLIYYWVDSTINVPVNTGIQRVVRQLARGLIEAGFRLVPVKWGNLDDPLYPVEDSELEHLAKWNGPAVDSWHPYVHPKTHRGGGWFMMNELPHNLAGVGHSTFREAATAAGLKTAAVFYDTIPWKMAELYPPQIPPIHLNYISQLAKYTKVLAISEYSQSEMKKVLGEEFQIPSSRLEHILAAPLAAEFPEKGEHAAVPPLREGVIEILCVGTVEPRKNHERLLDAFDLACQQSSAPLHLTIVGGSHSPDPDLPARVRARIAGDSRIVWEEKADDARIKLLYGRCDFSIYPSVEEGFGMPILESLWYGSPVICANFGAMQEVVAEGGGCVAVDVYDVVAMADAISDLANAPERLARLAAEAKVRTFLTWEGYTQDVAAKLELEISR